MPPHSNGVYVYVVAHGTEDAPRGPIKIGVAKQPECRLPGIQTGNPHDLCLHETVWFGSRESAMVMEQRTLRLHKDKRLRGEWLDMEPETQFIQGMMGFCHYTTKQRYAHRSDHECWENGQ